MSSALGRPLGALLGAAGRLGRENSMRSPRRTAQTAAALMVGIALVSAIAVLGASLSRSARTNLESAVTADDIITGPAPGSAPRSPPPSPGSRGCRRSRTSTRDSSSSGAHSRAWPRWTRRPAADGPPGHHSWERRSRPRRRPAADRHHHRERPAPHGRLAGTGHVRPDRPRDDADRRDLQGQPLIGSYLVGAGFFRSHFHNPLPAGVLISTQPGAGHVEGPSTTTWACTRTSGCSREPSSNNPSKPRSTRSSDSSTSCSPSPSSSR